MAYHCDNVRLEKGMYHEAGRTFTQVLEKLDPSEQSRAPPWRGWTPSSGSSSGSTSG